VCKATADSASERYRLCAFNGGGTSAPSLRTPWRHTDAEACQFGIPEKCIFALRFDSIDHTHCDFASCHHSSPHKHRVNTDGRVSLEMVDALFRCALPLPDLKWTQPYPNQLATLASSSIRTSQPVQSAVHRRPKSVARRSNFASQKRSLKFRTHCQQRSDRFTQTGNVRCQPSSTLRLRPCRNIDRPIGL
jgi:hypothetical protein